MALITMERVDSVHLILSEWTMNIFRRNMTEMCVVATSTITTVHWTRQINSAAVFILGSKSARVPPKGDHNKNSTCSIHTGNYTRQAQIFSIKYFEMQRLCCAVSCHFYGISFIDTYKKNMNKQVPQPTSLSYEACYCKYLSKYFSNDTKICFDGIIDYRV